MSSEDNKGRKIRLHGKIVSEDELHDYVKKIIFDKNITGTRAISKEIGKGERQTKRILDQMEFKGILKMDPTTRRLVKTQEQIEIQAYKSMKLDKFYQIPEIVTFVDEAKGRGVELSTLRGYVGALRKIFNFMKTHPRTVIVSRNSAIEFAKNLKKEFLKEHPDKKDTPQHWRVALRVYLDSVGGIAFGHGMAKGHGLGSHHDKFGGYAGVHIPIPTCRKLSNMMLEAKDYETYTFFNTGIMTGGRSGANASMVWERVKMDPEDFIVYQHETKDKGAGHKHVGKLGEWKKKTPPSEYFQILKDWRDRNPTKSKFVFIEDMEDDVLNRKAFTKFRNRVIPKLRTYLEKVKEDLDALTIEYIFEAGEVGHVNRHTFAQLLREKGMSSGQIAEAGGWDSAEIVDKWYTATSKAEREQSRKTINTIMQEPTKRLLELQEMQRQDPSNLFIQKEINEELAKMEPPKFESKDSVAQ